jgi:hypothetical protein
MYSDCDTPKGWVAPFGHSWIKACSQLPMTFRSVPRPSSPPGAKASTECPSHTQNHLRSRRTEDITHHAQEPSTPPINPDPPHSRGSIDVPRCFEPAHAGQFTQHIHASSCSHHGERCACKTPLNTCAIEQRGSHNPLRVALTGQTCCRRRAQRRTRT